MNVLREDLLMNRYPYLLNVVVVALLSFVALTRFHDGIEFSSWEIVANAVVLFSLLFYALSVLRLLPFLQDKRSLFQWLLFAVIIFFTLAAPMFGNAFHLSGVQHIGYHDGAAQTDYAFSAFVSGENPYQYDFSHSGFGDLYGRLVVNNERETIPNPALTQYIYLPAILIEGAVDAVQEHFFGISDSRPFMFVCIIGALLLLLRMLTGVGTETKILVATIFLLNPMYLRSLLEGRNDTFVLFLVVAACFVFVQGRYAWAGILFGIAFATKHFTWFFLPFLITYFVMQTQHGAVLPRQVKRFFSWSLGVAAVIILPFFLWSPSAFINDTFLYATGNGALAFPITGYGFSQLVTLFGQGIHTSFPFILLSLSAATFVGWLSIRVIRKTPLFWTVFSGAALTLFAFLFFSRMLNDNYIGFVFELLLVAFVVDQHSMMSSGHSSHAQ